jgi:hypothetical protein
MGFRHGVIIGLLPSEVLLSVATIAGAFAGLGSGADAELSPLSLWYGGFLRLLSAGQALERSRRQPFEMLTPLSPIYERTRRPAPV